MMMRIWGGAKQPDARKFFVFMYAIFKKVTVALFATLPCMPLAAQEKPEATTYTFRFVPGRDMFYVPWAKNGDELGRLLDCVELYKANILSGEVPLYVDGYSAAEGSEAANLAMAKIRSNRVKSELIVRRGLTEGCFVTHNHSGGGEHVTVRITVPFDLVKPDTLYAFRFVPGRDMFYAPWGGNGDELGKLLDFVEQNKADILSGKMPLYVNGYSTAGKSEAENLALAKIRSNRVKSELIVRRKLTEECFITRNHVGGGEYVTVQIAVPAQASATLPEEETEVVSDTVKTNVLEHVDVDKVEEARVEPVEEIPAQPALPKQSPVEETPKAAEKHPVGQVDKAKKVALRANLLRWATLTPDLGIEWRVNPSWGVLVNGSWTTWTWNGYDRRYALWEVMPEVRYYMGEKKAWYVGAMFKAGQFNYKLSDLGRQGDLLGGGITGGYQLRLTDALSMDFTLGLGYLHAACENYEVIDDVRVRSGNETKHWLGPINAGVTLVWKIF